MKFLKTSIVILFILSLLSAASSLYLANIRENEKEKRIYLEEVKTELEARVSVLEKQNSNLEQNVEQLTSEKKDLQEKLTAEQNAREEVMTMINQKDLDIETLRNDAQRAELAFKDAQKRNQELEKILDELEVRMRQIEGQSTLPGSEVGYLEIQPGGTSPQPVPEVQAVPEPPKPEAPDISFKPVTSLPEPPKKRKFLSFFRSSEKKPEPELEPKPIEPVPVVPEPEIVQPVQELPPVVIEPKPEQPAVKKAVQTIAGGSILLVNRQYNFAVVNLGSRHNLSLNDVLSIHRDGKEIAKARVEKLYEDYSAAYIIEERSEAPISEGDTVSQA